MKKFLPLIFLAFSALPLISQIPNASFESWTNAGTYETPDGWGNLNPYTSGTGVYTVTKGVTAPSAGLAYVKLMTRDIGGSNLKPGVLVSGQLDSVSLRPLSGFAFNSRPEKLKGKWQYMGYGTDAAVISAWLTKWNSSMLQRDTIAFLSASPTGMLHSWGTFSFPFTYRSAAYPDTAVIMISSSGNVPVKNSFIWFDDLTFDGTATSVREKDVIQSLSIYPNPATSFIKVSMNSPKEDRVTLILRDNIGNKVIEITEALNTGQNLVTIDLQGIQAREGIYFLQVQTSAGSSARKLVVK